MDDKPNIVWFKKDLRVGDHQPLSVASQQGYVVGIFIIEEEWLRSDEFSEFHLAFLRDCLIELKNDLLKLGIPLLVFQGESVSILSQLKSALNFTHLFSHMETGLQWTYQRDNAVRIWCRENNIEWEEYPQFALIRNLESRDTWNRSRIQIINRPLFEPPNMQIADLPVHSLDYIPPESIEIGANTEKIQKGGSNAADIICNEFLSERGEYYSASMSSPNTAYRNCSRLSPYISWGAISLSQITQKLKVTRDDLHNLPTDTVKNWRKSLKAFESRLWWHCHFIQKLETEPAIEFENMNRGFDGMREEQFNDELFNAWKLGETGYPMVDACMRALKINGWINFRMRAMLVSFASYHLWLHWRKTAIHLARLFTDFEPGIHYSQMQMQSGVTGINTIRIYSPIKQGMDHDPEGAFIKTYCPELESVDQKYIHQPHLMPTMTQHMCGCVIGKDYPAPIVEHVIAYKRAKEKIFKWRKKPQVKELAQLVYLKHGSRKSKFFPEQHRKAFGNFKAAKK